MLLNFSISSNLSIATRTLRTSAIARHFSATFSERGGQGPVHSAVLYFSSAPWARRGFSFIFRLVKEAEL
jgi:hypothetical protein